MDTEIYQYFYIQIHRILQEKISCNEFVIHHFTPNGKVSILLHIFHSNSVRQN